MNEENLNKKQGLPVWAAICISILSVAVIVLGVILLSKQIDFTKAEEPTTPTQAAAVTIESKNYTGTTDALIANRDQVVATVGNKELTNAKLQVYYWTCIYDFISSEYGYYLPYIGFDYTKDLATQPCYLDAKMSWQEYFLNSALDMWQWYAVMNIAAENAEFKLSAEDQEILDNLRETLETDAKGNGFADGQALVEHDMGAGATFDAYLEYYKETFIAERYSDVLWDGIEVTQDMMDKYYEDNKDTFDAEGIDKESVLVTVRHILIAPEDDTEAALEACRTKAQSILDEYLKGGKVDESAFAKLVEKHTADTASIEDGGAYSFLKGQMVEPFENWSFDASRKYGDTGLVESDYGYHIMLFVKREVAWIVYADYSVKVDFWNNLMDEQVKANPVVPNKDKVLLGHASFE